MSYIDLAYYKDTFKGKEISSDVFDRIVDTACDIIDSIVRKPIDSIFAQSNEVKKATAYEAELIYEHGGIDAITGLSDTLTSDSESLGSYAVSGSGKNIITKDGIPISAMAIAQLRKAGLMSKWLYSGVDVYAE